MGHPSLEILDAAKQSNSNVTSKKTLVGHTSKETNNGPEQKLFLDREKQFLPRHDKPEPSALLQPQRRPRKRGCMSAWCCLMSKEDAPVAMVQRIRPPSKRPEDLAKIAYPNPTHVRVPDMYVRPTASATYGLNGISPPTQPAVAPRTDDPTDDPYYWYTL